MSVSGNWKVNNRSVYTHGNNTVTFSGSSSQEINVYPSRGDFYNLRVSNTAATVSADSNAIVIDNTLTIDSNATFDIEGQNLTTATLTNNGNLQLQGGETVAISTMDTNSGTVTYDGTGTYTQLAAGDDYYNLTLNSSGSITLDADLEVDGALTITDGTLDVSTNNRSIDVAGNWSNSDTFVSRSGTVTFDGTSTVTTGGITANTKDFHHVILSGSATQSTNAIDIDGDFTISSSGTWDTSNLCMYVAGTTTTGSGTLTNAVATLSSSSPADGATGVSDTANIVLTFSEAVDVESGNIVIKKTSDDSTVETIDVTGSKVTGTGTTEITINPSVTLASNTGYYLTIAATAFDDCSSKSYAGITDATTLNFTTAVGDPPTLSSSSPADGATGVSATANIVLTFSEAVDVESGNITLYKSNGTQVEAIAVTNSKITGTGTDTITINPSAILASAAGYYLNIAATAFDDSSSNSYAGITDATTLNFTTANTGCTVNGVAETGAISLADLKTAIATGTDDVTTCDVSTITDMSRLFYLNTTFNQDISAWNPVSVTNMSSMFELATSFNRDISGWNTGAVTDMSSMFRNSLAFNNGGVALDWSDTSKVTDMSYMFYTGGTDVFNQDISAWNTGAVTNMSYMFYKVNDFNQDISDWNTGAVTNMKGMFYDAEAFNNGSVALDWSDTSKVTDMSYMFWYADVFNQDVSGWNTGAVTDMSYMFYGYNEKAFNNGGVVLDWSDTSKVTNMDSMFFNADAFNQDISGWNTGAVTSMYYMFTDAAAFNNGGVVLDWSDTSKVTNMSKMFYGAAAFNQDVSGWNTGAVTTMFYMFHSAAAFNNGGVALDWSDTSKVTTMVLMFKDAEAFNQDVSSWNTGAVTTMSSMFRGATAFNQDVSAWDVRNVTDMSWMFYGDTLSTANYDALLIAWDALELWDDVSFHGGSSKYTTCSAASDAREKMIATDGDSWTITDGGAIPTMTITAVEVFDGATSNDATLSLTFTSCEETADFVVGDITVTGGSLSSFAASSSKVYTATFTPTTEGATTIDVQAAKFTSTYGANENSAATQFNWTYSTTTSDDTTAPTITFSPADSATGVAVTSNITLTFNEAIRNTDDSALTSSTVGSLITLKNTNSSGSDINFVATIDEALKVITINPNSDFSSEQVVYVAIEASVEDFFGNAISASSTTFTATDSTAPTLVFDPEDLESAVPVTDNITITFSEAIRNTDDSTLTSTNVDSLITLKDSDENGTDIDFNATIDSDKKIITINPDSNFSSEQIVYVAIGATVEDASDNAISESSVTFNAADSTAPSLDFTPVDSATGIAVNSDITIAFDEVIRNTDDSALTDSNVDSLITLKTTNSSGSDIDFDAVIDDSKKLITISPSSDFSSEQVIYVAIGATVEDASDNAISASSITFTAADSTAPTVAFVPPDTSSCIPISSNVSLTFSEAVRNPDDSDITDANVGDIITLEYRSDGSPVAFTATINSAKTVITINPDSDFVSGEVISVAIESVEDTSNNTMSATSGTFCVVDSTAPTIEFSPADLSTMVAEDTDIILTFDEEIRLTNDSALTNTNVDSLITLKTTNSSGTDIAFDATIDSDNKVITIDLVSNLSSNQIVYVAIGATVEDSYNNAITAASATFTTGDSLPPTVKIEAVITASIATDSDITFTFSEAVRNLDDTELTNSNVGSLMTLKDTDANGSDIPFSATINPAKTIITINPTSNFTSQQVIYAAIGATVEDYSDNV
ncbi:MAG: BspA family leucine-rich repeat surface protein, partial [Porticoccaceae bacterium]|nr:BspA family leucine-rich repeat surface protein [Porticoccaceae bacterium]